MFYNKPIIVKLRRKKNVYAKAYINFGLSRPASLIRYNNSCIKWQRMFYRLIIYTKE